MTDERSIMAMEIMASASISAGSVNPRLLALIGLGSSGRHWKHGSHPLSAMGYASTGCCSAASADRLTAAMRLGSSPCVWRHRSGTRNTVSSSIFRLCPHQSLERAYPGHLQPLRDLTSTGEFEYLVVAAGVVPYFTWFISGLDIGTNERAFTENDICSSLSKARPCSIDRLGYQYYQNLLGWSDNASQLVGKAYDERAQLPIHLQDNDRATIFYLACHKLVLCYLYENYVEAEAAAQLARQYSDGGIGTPLVPVLYFTTSLAHLARYPGGCQSRGQADSEGCGCQSAQAARRRAMGRPTARAST
ncbi:MAG: hypothetical protein IPO81_18585 [Kouleothrix sp.]|nr:hypothetical protein [Kouleothrix sp.]